MSRIQVRNNAFTPQSICKECAIVKFDSLWGENKEIGNGFLSTLEASNSGFASTQSVAGASCALKSWGERVQKLHEDIWTFPGNGLKSSQHLFAEVLHGSALPIFNRPSRSMPDCQLISLDPTTAPCASSSAAGARRGVDQPRGAFSKGFRKGDNCNDLPLLELS